MSTAGSRLKAGEALVIDGAIATELLARAVPVNDKPTGFNSIPNVESPDAVKAVHADYIAAGVDVLSTNTFGCGRAELAAVGLGDRFEEINRAAVKLALDARAESGRTDITIAGVISCVSRSGSILGSYEETASVLADAGVDVIAVEMIGTLADGTEAIAAVKSVGLPVWVGVSADRGSDGGLITLTHDEHFTDFDPPEDLRTDVAAFAAMDIDVLTVMHTEIPLVDDSLALMRQEFDGPLGAYPHHGSWQGAGWNDDDPVTPDDFATAALGWVDRGAQIVGGCCGIGPAHIAAVKSALVNRATA